MADKEIKTMPVGIRKISALFSAVLLIVAAAMAFSLFIPADPFSKELSMVYIKYGSGSAAISKELCSQKLVRNALAFRIYLVLSRQAKSLKAGEYEFNRSDNSFAIAAKMVRGDVVRREITFPEGLDSYEMAEMLAAEKIADGKKFLGLVKDKKFLRSIGINRETAEGMLFPDTYNFLKGETEEKIITVMHERFIEKSGLDTDKVYNVSGYRTTGYGVLRMASIIEKEAKLDLERPLVASVFYNRLKSPEAYMRRLESCATVRYALNKKTGIITYNDLKCESPFNTYIAIGLPPAPICNPGLKSIQAALKPADTEFRYFVVERNGGHTFSKTLEEHNNAKVKNRKIKR